MKRLIIALLAVGLVFCGATFALAKKPIKVNPNDKDITVELLGESMTMAPTVLQGVNNEDTLSVKGTGTVTISPDLQGLGPGPLDSVIEGEIAVYLDKASDSTNISLKFEIGGVRNQLIVRQFSSVVTTESQDLTSVVATDGEAVRIIYYHGQTIYKVYDQDQSYTATK